MKAFWGLGPILFLTGCPATVRADYCFNFGTAGQLKKDIVCYESESYCKKVRADYKFGLSPYCYLYQKEPAAPHEKVCYSDMNYCEKVRTEYIQDTRKYCFQSKSWNIRECFKAEKECSTQRKQYQKFCFQHGPASKSPPSCYRDKKDCVDVRTEAAKTAKELPVTGCKGVRPKDLSSCAVDPAPVISTECKYYKPDIEITACSLQNQSSTSGRESTKAAPLPPPDQGRRQGAAAY